MEMACFYDFQPLIPLRSEANIWYITQSKYGDKRFNELYGQ